MATSNFSDRAPGGPGDERPQVPAGAGHSARRRRRLPSVLGAIGGVLLVLWQVVAFRGFLQTLEWQPVEPPPGAAIVALAGASGRLDRGVDLLSEGRADLLLLSGTGKGVSLQNIFPGRDLSKVPEGKVILLESRSTSTYENAIEAWAVLAARGEVDDVVLLTSNYHMLRAEYVFRKVFPPEVRIHPYPVVKENVVTGTWWRHGRSRKVILTEYVKYLWYRVRY